MFSFYWTIECLECNYPLCPGENVESPIFYVEPSKTFEFCLELYPKGRNACHINLLKQPATLLLLRCDENPRNIRLKGSISADIKGKGSISQQFDCVFKKCRKQTYKFCESSVVTSLLLPDKYDAIPIHCEIEKVEIDELTCCNKCDLEALSSAFSELIKNGFFTDEKLNVGCEEVFIHKAILSARCVGKTFEEKLKNLKILWSFILSEAGSSTCRMLIEFLYSGKLDYSNVIDELCISLKKLDVSLLKHFETHTTSMVATTLFKEKKISFVWSIEDYSDSFSKENIFRIAEGSPWEWMKCVLKPHTNSIKDGFVIIIHRLDCTTNCFLHCSVSLKENGHTVDSKDHKYLFKGKDDFQTDFEFKIDQQKHKLLSNTSLNLHIVIYLCKNEYVTKITHTSVSQFAITDFTKLQNLHDLADDVKLLLENYFLHDVVLEVDEKKFPAHKAILSVRSSVFDSMFKQIRKKKSCKSIPIKNIKSKVFSALLSYIYCAHVNELDFETAFDLYEAAIRFEILSLKQKCSMFLKSVLTVENVYTVKRLAETYFDSDFQESCKEFLKYNSEQMEQCQEL